MLAVGRVAIARASGLIGSAVTRRLACYDYAELYLVARNYDRLVRLKEDILQSPHHGQNVAIHLRPVEVHQFSPFAYPVHTVIDCSGSWRRDPTCHTVFGDLYDRPDIALMLLYGPLVFLYRMLCIADVYYQKKGTYIWAAGSMAGLTPFVGQSFYGMYKAAIRMHLLTLQKTHQHDPTWHDFKISLITSGLVQGTDIQAVLGQDAQIRGELVPPEQIADAVVYCLEKPGFHDIILPGNYEVV